MKLIQLKCPSCGAKLEINPSLDKYTCNYCGVTTILDDEKIIVKNVSSKLQNYLTELEEYFDNGNYRKCYVMAEQLLDEYPKNKEIKDYYEKCHEELFGEEERRQKKLEEERQRRLEEVRKQREEFERQQQEAEQKRIAEQQARKEKINESARKITGGIATGAAIAGTAAGIIIFKILNIILYIFGGMIIIASPFISGVSILGKILYFLWGISLLKVCYSKIPNNNLRIALRIIVPIIILILIGVMVPINNNNNTNTNDQTTTTTTTVVAQ